MSCHQAISNVTALAADIGGTKIRVSLIRGEQELDTRLLPTEPGIGPEGWLQPIRQAAQDWAGRFECLGVAVTGQIDGTMWGSVNPEVLSVGGAFPLVSALSDICDQVIARNDAQSAAWAEHIYGAAKGLDLVYLTISTGLGGGIVCNGKLLRGHRGLAGHFGQISPALTGDDGFGEPFETFSTGRWRHNLICNVEEKMRKSNKYLATAAAALLAVLPSLASAEVTVLGWRGGPEEEALRAATKLYNSKAEVCEDNKVKLIFFSRDGFYDKLQADLAAGTDAFDANLLATYSIGRYAPYLKPVTLSDNAAAVFGDAVLKTMQFEGQQFGVPTDLSLHFLYYRTDLIQALLDDASQHENMAISRRNIWGSGCRPKIPTTGAGRTLPPTHCISLNRSMRTAQPVRHRASAEKPAVQHDGIPFAATCLWGGLDGWRWQYHR